MSRSESLSPRKSSRSSPPAVGKARHHDPLSGTVPRSDHSRDLATKRKSESLEAVAPCSTTSTSADEVSSSASTKASPSSTVVGSSFASTSAGTTTATSCERVETGGITQEIVPHVDSTVPPSLFDELEQVFQNFDVNKDGKISPSELRDVLEALGDHATDEEAIQMLKAVDTDGDGYIDLDNFISISATPIASSGDVGNSDELKAAFNMFDANKEGYITAEKLENVLSRLTDGDHTIEECKKMIQGVDVDGDGKVNFEDFKRMMA